MTKIPEHPRCPFCGSDDTERHWGDQLMQFGAGFVGGIAQEIIGSTIGFKLDDKIVDNTAQSIVDEISQKFICKNCEKTFTLAGVESKRKHIVSSCADDVVTVVQKYALKYGKTNRRDFSNSEIEKLAKRVNLTPADLTSRLDHILSMPKSKDMVSPKSQPQHKQPSKEERVLLFKKEISQIIEDYGSLNDIPEQLIINIGGSFGFSAQKTMEMASEVAVSPMPPASKTSKSKKNLSIKPLNEGETTYISEYQACLEDGVISEREQRLLNRLALSLGISSERQSQLHDMCMDPRLSEKEKEYLEEYLACLADGEVFLPATIRLLKRLAESLGLSDTQVEAIHHYAKKQ